MVEWPFQVDLGVKVIDRVAGFVLVVKMRSKGVRSKAGEIFLMNMKMRERRSCLRPSAAAVSLVCTGQEALSRVSRISIRVWKKKKISDKGKGTCEVGRLATR